MSEKWLEFRVEDENCPHEPDIGGPECPLCEIDRLEEQLLKATKYAASLHMSLSAALSPTQEPEHTDDRVWRDK